VELRRVDDLAATRWRSSRVTASIFGDAFFDAADAGHELLAVTKPAPPSHTLSYDSSTPAE